MYFRYKIGSSKKAPEKNSFYGGNNNSRALSGSNRVHCILYQGFIGD